MNRFFLCSAVLLLAACGNKSESPAAQAEAAAPQVTALAPAEALEAPPAPAGINGEPVDTCALLDGGAAAKSVGTLFKEPEAQTAQGSLLGGCNYIGERGMVMITARPASEYDATVRYAGKEGGAKPVSDLPGNASLTPAGLMLQPNGKPYFLVVYPLLSGKFDDAVAVALARQLKL